MMRNLFIILFLVQSLIVFGQVNGQVAETICIKPYIPDEVQLPDNHSRQLLLDKLTLVVTQNGLGYKGYDNRFVISANIHNISETRTATIPTKVALKMSLTLYIGDGMEGTLFSSVNIELKGIGGSYEEAYCSALYKIKPNNEDVIRCLELGKNRILLYYDSIGESIIQKAKSFAANADYDDAISSLFTIPMQCKHYQRAQEMISMYSEKRIDAYNNNLLVKAQAAWHSSMDEIGAERAMNIMSEVQYPSESISNMMNKLCAEVSSRLKTISNQRWQIKMQQIQNRHKEEMAQIQSDKERSLAYAKVAASVAKAWSENRPNVVYRIYRWWY